MFAMWEFVLTNNKRFLESFMKFFLFTIGLGRLETVNMLIKIPRRCVDLHNLLSYILEDILRS